MPPTNHLLVAGTYMKYVKQWEKLPLKCLLVAGTYMKYVKQWEKLPLSIKRNDSTISRYILWQRHFPNKVKVRMCWPCIAILSTFDHLNSYDRGCIRTLVTHSVKEPLGPVVLQCKIWHLNIYGCIWRRNISQHSTNNFPYYRYFSLICITTITSLIILFLFTISIFPWYIVSSWFLVLQIFLLQKSLSGR